MTNIRYVCSRERNNILNIFQWEDITTRKWQEIKSKPDNHNWSASWEKEKIFQQTATYFFLLCTQQDSQELWNLFTTTHSSRATKKIVMILVPKAEQTNKTHTQKVKRYGNACTQTNVALQWITNKNQTPFPPKSQIMLYPDFHEKKEL